MDAKEFVSGLDPEKQSAYENDLIHTFGDGVRTRLEESQTSTQNWNRQNYIGVNSDFHQIHIQLVEALTRFVPSDSPQVQSLIHTHYEIVSRFWNPDQESYIGLSHLYCDHPEFRKLYDGYHLELAPYLAEAMQYFARTSLAA